ncbi:MAG: CheR family methyltransferase [Rhodocyclaceae bacterium]|nr:CheR family methyltransferase [Rhodocyclaceae bacterium]
MSAVLSPSPVACEERLCAFVRARTGLRIHDHQMETLRRTVAEACARFGHADCASYLAVLEAAASDSPEHEHMIAGITVGESYFFRDHAQMDFLRRVWLPDLIERRRQANDLFLRIWSAGCADGQELYSLVILLHELLPDIDRWNLHLLGTDINAGSLARAMRGRYSNWSFRAMPPDVREQFFQKEDEQHWQVSPHLRRRVKFTYLNLNEDSFPSILTETGNLDLILCRNVFIYFDPGGVGRIVAKLRASLVPGGCLLLGTSDLIDSATLDGFDLRALANAFYLVRHDEAAPVTPPQSETAPPRIKRPAPEPGSQTPVAVEAPVAMPILPAPRGLADIGEIIRLLGNEAWPGALAKVEQRQQAGDDSATIWQFRAKALANLGRARDALEACDRSLVLDPTDKHTHFIRALVLLELNRLPAAEDALKRTLYLDRGFVEAHFHLGLLRLRRDRRAAGLKSLRNALAIADATTPDRRLHDAAGMNHGRIAAILRNELDMREQTSRRKKQ